QPPTGRGVAARRLQRLAWQIGIVDWFRLLRAIVMRNIAQNRLAIGAQGRNGRPGLDTMLKDTSRRKFDVGLAWAIDRLGASLSDLLDTIQHLEACGVDLYLDQQAIDTTTPDGQARFPGSWRLC